MWTNHSFARGVLEPGVRATVASMVPCGSLVATYTSSSKGTTPRTGKKWMFGQHSVTSSTPGTAASAALAIRNSVSCTPARPARQTLRPI